MSWSNTNKDGACAGIKCSGESGFKENATFLLASDNMKSGIVIKGDSPLKRRLIRVDLQATLEGRVGGRVIRGLRPLTPPSISHAGNGEIKGVTEQILKEAVPRATERGGGDNEPDWLSELEGGTGGSSHISEDQRENEENDFDLWAKIIVAFGILFIGALYGTILPL